MSDIKSTIGSLVAARDLMCTKLGVELVREQVVEPFGFVMIQKVEREVSMDALIDDVDTAENLAVEEEAFVTARVLRDLREKLVALKDGAA